LIDISHWERDLKSQASGTRKKFWLFKPKLHSEKNATKYLFKVPTEETGGHWAEFVASSIGRKLGFYAAEVELATHKGIVGTISKNFRPKTEELYEGGDLFSAQFDDFDRYSLKYYELPNIIEILAVHNIEKEFVSIPVFDALIANNDRHCDNWGILRGPKSIRLAPIYDNGSSIGFNVVTTKKQKMLIDNKMLAGFCNRGKPSIGLPGKKRPKHFELLFFLHKYMPEELKLNIKKLEKLNNEIVQSTLKDIPNDIMSDLDKEWITHLILYRKKWILNWFEGV